MNNLISNTFVFAVKSTLLHNTLNMKLIADSGSSKTDWTLIDESGKIMHNITTEGINPFYQNTKEIINSLKSNYIDNSHQPEEIFFYGAGCATEEKNNLVKVALETFFQSRKVFVHSDLLGSARALCQNKKGIACILGTGSNSCYYDGEKIVENISPLGYILGDEGSGSVMGKIFIADLLKNQLPTEITSKFFNHHKINTAEIVNSVYKEPFPNRFLAKFSTFILQNMEVPELKNIVLNNFKNFIERNLLQYPEHKQLPIHFVGSIAYYFKNELLFCLEEYNLSAGTITQSPMDGLLKYHGVSC